MFKCVECNEIFKEMIYQKEPHGEIIGHSPCGCNNFDGAIQCKICAGWHVNDNVNAYSICKDCVHKAKIEFTIDLGIEIVKYTNQEIKFYVNYAAGIKNSNCEDLELLNRLKPVRRELKHIDIIVYDTPIIEFAEKLQEWCLDDLAEWAEFYYQYKKERIIS